MTPDQQRLEFFCLTHEEVCYATRAQPTLGCAQGHVLSEDFQRDKWEYCCGCESFFARDDHEAARSKCPRCGRQLVARYLCHHCATLSAESVELSQHSFGFVAGAPQTCPCCLTKPATQLTEHQCRQLHARFSTARSECPLCAEMIIPQRRFEFQGDIYLKKPLREYLRVMNGRAVRASLAGTQPPLLLEKADGAFWLTKHNADGYFTVFPSVERLNSAQDFAPLQPLFDGDGPAAGELWIAAPAVAYFNQARQCWVITQKGQLQVRPAAPAAPVMGEPVLRAPSPVPLPPPVFDPSPADKPASLPQMDRPIEKESLPPDKPLAPNSGINQKKTLLVVVVALATILIAVILYLFFASPKRQIISKVKQGQIVTPIGNSAYELFLNSNLSDSDRAEVRQEITPLLEAKGNEVIRQLVSDGYTPSVSDSENTAKIFDWLDKLSAQNSYKARKHYFLGRAAFDRKDFNGAENDIRRAMSFEANWALPVNHMGRIFVQRKDYLTAQGWYQRAVELDPSWMVPKINLCVVAVENLKNYPLGEQACRGVLQLDQNKASGYYFLGRALEEQNRRCDALREFRTAIEKASGNTSPGFNVDRLNQRLPRLTSQCGG